jgi:signal peptidase I
MTIAPSAVAPAAAPADAGPGDGASPPSRRPRLIRFWREQLLPLLIVVFALLTFRSAVADWYDVPSGSMKPTILEGDRIFVNKLAYDLKIPFTRIHLAEWADPRRSDVVILYSPTDGKRLVKRVIGLPGDMLELRANKLFINGAPVDYQPLDNATILQLPEAERPSHLYATEELLPRPHPVMTTPGVVAARSFEPVTIPAGQFFVMGDNRDNSADSRFIGLIDRARIVGRTRSIAFSLDDSYLPRLSRFFRRLP